MVRPNMIIHRILDHFHSPAVYRVDEFLVSLITPEACVNFIMICECIPVLSTIWHVIFNHGIQPECCNTEVFDIVEVILNTLQISAMTVEYSVAVQGLVSHAGNPVI